MQTGYHSPEGGAYLPTSQDNSVRRLPTVYLPNETQISMVAAQPPGEHRVAYDPARCEQGSAQSQHIQDGRNFGLFANANSIRQFADNRGQRKDSSKHYFSEPLQNSSKLSTSTGLSGQLCTDKVLAAGVPKIYTDEEIYEYIKEKLAYFRANLSRGPPFSSMGCPNDSDSPLQSHRSIPKSNSVTCHPTSSDKGDAERQSLSCAVVEHCTVATGQALEEDRSKGSKANAELPPNSKETSETSASERLLPGTLISDVQNATNADFDLHLDINDGRKPVCTDDCEDKTFVSSSDGSFQSKWCNRYTLNGITTLHYSLTALKELIASLENVKTIAKIDNFSEVLLQQYWNGDRDNVHLFTSTEYPQIMNEAAATCTKTEEESPVVLTAMSGVTSDEPTEKYPGLIPSCSTSQEESKSVWVNADKDDGVPAVSSPLIHVTHKDRGDLGLQPMEVDDVQGVINDSKDSRTPRINGDQDVDINKHKNSGNQQHSPVTSKEAAAHSNSSLVKVQINDAQSGTTNQSELSVCNQTSCKSMRKDASYVCSQVDSSMALPVNKDAELTPLSGRVDKENPTEPQYEDISDDDEDMSRRDMKLTEPEEFHFSFLIENPAYEDISEDENPPIQNTDVEIPSLPCDGSEPSVKPYGHVQVQMKSISDVDLIPMKQVTAKTETSSTAQHCSCPHFDETDDSECVSGAKCDQARHAEWQTNHPCSPSSDLEDEDETDDEMDNDWDVIPLIISELKLELPEDGADPEDVLPDAGEHGDNVIQGGTSPTLGELRRPPPVQVPASAFSQIEVFDTCESFQQAKAVQFGRFSQFLSEESLPERDPKSHHSRRDSYSEPEDSYETDDSCNYSPVEEHNHLTVSKKLLNSLSAPASSETNDSESEKENVDDEVTYLQNDQIGSRQNTCIKEDVIVLNSDTEDECDQICMNTEKRRKGFSLQNEVSAAEPCSPQRKHSSETVARVCESVKENLLTSRLLSAHSSERTESSGQLCENTARSEHVQHEAAQQNVSNDESITIIDSDSEDDSSQNYSKAKSKREFSSGWAGAGNDPCGKQERTPVDTEYETAGKKLQECRAAADSSKPQRGSKHQYTHSKEEMQDTCSDLSHSMKRGQLPEAKTGSVHVWQKINKQMTSKRFYESDHVVSTDKILKKKAKMKRRVLSSETEDSDSDLFHAQKSPHVSNKTQNTIQSSEDSSEKQPQSGTDRETDGTVSCSPVIPRLLVENLPQSSGHLKLRKQSVAQDKDEMPKKRTSTSKSLDSCKTKTQLLHGDTQGKLASNPNPANDRHHVTPPSKCNKSSSSPRNISSSSRLQQQHSYNIPSSFTHPYPPTNGPSAMTQVTDMWRESYFSTRKDKKPSVGMEEGRRPKNSHDFLKEVKPGRRPCDKAPRRKNSSQESATPLMKRTMIEARELTRARSWDASREQTGCHVREGYKWNK